VLAPGRPIRALASDGSAAARFKSGDVSAVDRVAKHVDVANNFYDVAKSFSHVANRCACNIQRRMLRSMLRVCVWYVASSRACNIQHQESFFPPPLHVATILRPCCGPYLRATFNIRSPLPLLLDTNPTSNVCKIATQHSQH
jgi:hypothetical protein